MQLTDGVLPGSLGWAEPESRHDPCRSGKFVAGAAGSIGAIDDLRGPWRVASRLAEVPLLIVCGTICDCEDDDEIAEGGDRHLDGLRRSATYHHGVLSRRWLTLQMNRLTPCTFCGRLNDVDPTAGSLLKRHLRADLRPRQWSRAS